MTTQFSIFQKENVQQEKPLYLNTTFHETHILAREFHSYEIACVREHKLQAAARSWWLDESEPSVDLLQRLWQPSSCPLLALEELRKAAEARQDTETDLLARLETATSEHVAFASNVLKHVCLLEHVCKSASFHAIQAAEEQMLATRGAEQVANGLLQRVNEFLKCQVSLLNLTPGYFVHRFSSF